MAISESSEAFAALAFGKPNDHQRFTETRSPRCFFDTANIAQRRSSPDIPTVFEGSQITIEVPLGYAQRDQLLSFMESKLPGAEITIVHSEVTDPTVAEAFVRHDLTTEPAQKASEVPGENSAAVLLKASDALIEFIK